MTHGYHGGDDQMSSTGQLVDDELGRFCMAQLVFSSMANWLFPDLQAGYQLVNSCQIMLKTLKHVKSCIDWVIFQQAM